MKLSKIKYVMPRLALFLNLVGVILLALSFGATSSDFRLVTSQVWNLKPGGNPTVTDYAICVKNYTLAVTDALGSMAIGRHDCPDWEDAHPAAVVIAEHPGWLQTGLICSILGFLIQLFTVPKIMATPVEHSPLAVQNSSPSPDPAILEETAAPAAASSLPLDD